LTNAYGNLCRSPRRSITGMRYIPATGTASRCRPIGQTHSRTRKAAGFYLGLTLLQSRGPTAGLTVAAPPSTVGTVQQILMDAKGRTLTRERKHERLCCVDRLSRHPMSGHRTPIWASRQLRFANRHPEKLVGRRGSGPFH